MNKPTLKSELVVRRALPESRLLDITTHNNDVSAWIRINAGVYGELSHLNGPVWLLRVYDGYDVDEVINYLSRQGK